MPEFGRPYWWATPPSETSDPLPNKVDLLVIGAGYTGLSAALAAADCGASVAVVDAGVPGAGASTRNGGMFGAHPRLSWDALEKMFGADVADGVFAEANVALRWAEELIAREGIDCDLQRTGRIQLAWTKAHFARQKALAARVREKSDVAVEIVERADLGGEIGTGRYHGGLLFPEHGAVDPAKYHAGLLAAVRRRGVPVVAHAAVHAVGDGVETAKGRVAAGKVVLATGGYTPAAFRWHQRRVFPLPSFLIATEEIDPNLLGHLAPGRRMMVETRARHSYFRVSPDGKRVLYGGRASMVPVALDKAAARLKATMAEVWPELEEVGVTHAWTGNTGYSFTHMPHVGAAEGMHYALGFSGSGTVLAPYLGAKAAYQALGDARGETAYSRTALRGSWMHRFARPWFLYPANAWYRGWVDGAENRAARR